MCDWYILQICDWYIFQMCDWYIFQMCDHVTVPLIAMVSELSRQQEELMMIVEKKDKEIDDYKSQGVRPSRSQYSPK